MTRFATAALMLGLVLPGVVAADDPPRKPDGGKYAAYWLTQDPPGPGCSAAYPVLLLARVPMEELTANAYLLQLAYNPKTPDRQPPLLDGLGLTFVTYKKDSVWNADGVPFKPVRSVENFRPKERRVTINGTAYRYEECPLGDVVRLLERPEGTVKIARIHPPLGGAEQTARALRLLLKEQLAADEPKPKEVSIYDVVHKRADLPGPGTEVPSPKDKGVVYYVTNTRRMWGGKANVGKHAGLYASRDGGKTWRLRCTKFEFEKLFVHPDTGHLFAIITYDWLATDEKDGTLQHHYSNKVITSADGEKWKDITGGQGYITNLADIFADPDHPGRVCLRANMIRAVVLQSKDEKYSDWDIFAEHRPEGRRLLERAGLPNP